MHFKTCFNLIMAEKDQQAKESLRNCNRGQLIIFLTAKLASLTTLAELESVDIMAHFGHLRLVARENDSLVEDFAYDVLATKDLGTYNRCGSRLIKDITDDRRLTYVNVKKDYIE